MDEKHLSWEMDDAQLNIYATAARWDIKWWEFVSAARGGACGFCGWAMLGKPTCGGRFFIVEFQMIDKWRESAPYIYTYLFEQFSLKTIWYWIFTNDKIPFRFPLDT